MWSSVDPPVRQHRAYVIHDNIDNVCKECLTLLTKAIVAFAGVEDAQIGA